MTQEKTMNGKTLVEWLQSPACAELDAVAHELATGDDLRVRNDADIAAAVGATLIDLRVTLDLTEIIARPGQTDAEFFQRFYIFVWHTRETRPYADALEAAVEAWRRPAPSYSQDTPEGWWAMRQMLAEMAERGWFCFLKGDTRIPVFPGENFAWCFGKVGGPHYGKAAETLPLAVTRAAIAALWAEGRDE